MNKYIKTQLKKTSVIAFLMIAVLMASCSSNSEQAPAEEVKTEEPTTSAEPAALEEIDPMKDKGIGPVTSVEIGPIDEAFADKGRVIFESKCSACHKFDSKYVGPALKGVTTRRTPEWIMNMILNPVEMTQKNAAAKSLLEEHLTQMTFQDLTQEEARAVLEYFRLNDSK
jgi:hypothetical protein